MHKIVRRYLPGLVILSVALWPIIALARIVRKRRSEDGIRVLVVPQLTRLGDIVCSTPVFRAIKEKYPNAHLSVLVSKKAGGILKHNTRIDKLLYIEDYQSFFPRLIFDIIRFRFDAGVSLSGTTLSSVLFWLGLIPVRIKLVQEDKPLMERLSDWTANYQKVYKNHTFLPGFYLSLLEPLGIHNAALIKEVVVLPEHRKKVGRYLKEAGARAGDLLVGISITAGNKIKEWGDRKFLALADAIVERYAAKIVVLGGPGDWKRIDNLITQSKYTGSYIRTDAFTLDELPAVMERVDLYIAVDTGPIYVAHALGVPLIDIVGPIDPREQPPSDEKSIALCPPAGIEPSSFVFKRPGRPEEHLRALESITLEMVMGAAAKLLR